MNSAEFQAVLIRLAQSPATSASESDALHTAWKTSNESARHQMRMQFLKAFLVGRGYASGLASKILAMTRPVRESQNLDWQRDIDMGYKKFKYHVSRGKGGAKPPSERALEQRPRQAAHQRRFNIQLSGH